MMNLSEYHPASTKDKNREKALGGEISEKPKTQTGLAT